MGLYSNLGRVLGALLSLAMPCIAVWQASSFILALYVGLSGVLVALIELPILCSCNKYCQILAQYTRILGSLWIVRAGIYIGIAAGGFAIYQVKGFKPSTAGMDANSYLLVPLVLLVLNSLLYIAAIYKKEDPPGGAAPKPVTPSPAAGGGSVTSMFAGMLGRSAAKAAVENPGAAAAFTAAAAPTLAQQMFGGGGASASKEASAKSFYDDEESGGGYVAPSVPIPTTATAPNTRSGLFGGFGGGGAASVPKTNTKMEAPVTNSKMSAPPAPAPATSYGFPGENDVRDINPFMS